MARQLKLPRRAILAGLAGAAAATVPALRPRRSWAQSAPATVTFAWPFAYGEKGVNELAKRFSDERKSVQIEVQVIPQAQVIPKLTTAFTGGSAPDCMAMSDAWLVQFANGGCLESLEPFIKSSGIESSILPASMDIGRMHKGTAHYVGFMVEAYALYYNRKIFAEAGIERAPVDVDEFRSVAIKLTDPRRNRFGYYVLGGSGWQFQQWSTWMVNHGGLGVNRTLYGTDGKCILSGPKHVEGLQKWLALYQTDKVSPPASATGTFQDQLNAFNAGQLGMVFGWGGYLTSLAQGIGEDALGTALPPIGPAGQFSYYGGNGYCISSASKNKEAAWEFINFLLKPENNSEWNRVYGAIPTNITTWNAPWLQAPKYQAPLAALRKQDSLVNNPRYLPGYASFQLQFAAEQIQKTLLGRQTAQEHGKAVAAALDELRAKAT
jgi:multiple sugar transport system substrate-binding protein